jgi:hypothetical protein
MSTNREVFHAAVRSASEAGCCNTPGCAHDPGHSETMLCDAVVDAMDAKDAQIRARLVEIARRFWRAGMTSHSDGVTEAILELDRFLTFAASTRALATFEPHVHRFEPIRETRYGNMPTIHVCSCTAWKAP